MNAPALVVLGTSLTALAVARVAHRKRLRVTLLDEIEGPAASTGCAAFRRLRSMDPEVVLAAIDEVAAGGDVAVVADSDRWVRFVRTHRKALDGPRRLVLHPCAEALDVCLDKSAFLRWCAAHDLPAPRLYDATDRAAVQYPVMLRPEETQHSRPTGLPKALEVREAGEFAYWLDRYAAAGVAPNVSESLLRDGLRQFSVGAARNAAGATLTFLAEKVRPEAAQCAGGTFVRPANAARIEDLARAALDALDFLGIAEVEVLHDPASGRSWLIEVNGRPWLQFGLPYACGCDLLAHVLGTPSTAGAASRAHAWLYFSSDLYACFSRSTGLVSRGRLGIVEYVRTLLAADVYASWDWRDPAPVLVAWRDRVAARVRRILGRR